MRESLEGFIEPGSEEEKLVNKLDFSRLPRHIAVIMDGNGRWAKKRKLPRMEGHRAGAKSVREVVETCARLGIQYLTLYAFSKENWRRPKKEVATLWKLLEEYLKKEDKTLVENQFNLSVKTIRIDGGGEFSSKTLADFLKTKDILHKKSCPYTTE